MAHDFLIKDVAFQAGLSTATVDRVVNNRGGVRRQTRARVEAAIEELREQEKTASLAGKTYIFDIVMETPARFSQAARSAFESAAAAFLPAVVRSRFHFAERMREPDLLLVIDKIRKRGSHGVVLKAQDTKGINDAVAGLTAARIPVITLVTDLPSSTRIAYAGSDNRSPGATAAYLIGSTLRQGAVLAALSSNSFQGEEERLRGFRDLLVARWPQVPIVEISEGYGTDRATGALVRAALAENPDIRAVYSIGGANRAILEAFEDLGHAVACFVAHDLDRDNIELLRQEKLHYVLHHNLNADAASVIRSFLNHHNAIPQLAGPLMTAIEIVTPFNLSLPASAYPRS